MDKEKGLFIVFEGIDGAGKDFHMNKLLYWFTRRDEPCVQRHSPSYSTIGLNVRNLLRQKKIMATLEGTPLESTLINMLVATDSMYQTYNNEDGYVKLMSEGINVVQSRGILSAMCYYDHDERSYNLLLDLYRHVLLPDITIYLDCPADIAMERINKRGVPHSYHETEEKLDKIRQKYLNCLRAYVPYSVTVNTTQSKEKASDEVIKHVEDYINGKL